MEEYKVKLILFFSQWITVFTILVFIVHQQQEDESVTSEAMKVREGEPSDGRTRTSSQTSQSASPPAGTAGIDLPSQSATGFSDPQETGQLRLDDETEYPPLTVHNDWVKACKDIKLVKGWWVIENRNPVFPNRIKSHSRHVSLVLRIVVLDVSKTISDSSVDLRFYERVLWTVQRLYRVFYVLVRSPVFCTPSSFAVAALCKRTNISLSKILASFYKVVYSIRITSCNYIQRKIKC